MPPSSFRHLFEIIFRNTPRAPNAAKPCPCCATTFIGAQMHQASSLTSVNRAVIGIALVLPTLITWIYFILLDGAPSALQQSAYLIGKLAQFALPVVWVCL